MLMFIDGEGLSRCSCSYLDLDTCRRHKLLDLGKCLLERGLRDVGHEDIGTLLRE
jgi:hypothetical protein